MQVILLDKVANCGKPWVIRLTLKRGYARNFLVPQGKAVPASQEKR